MRVYFHVQKIQHCPQVASAVHKVTSELTQFDIISSRICPPPPLSLCPPSAKMSVLMKEADGQTDREQFWRRSSQQADVMLAKVGCQFFSLLFTQFCLPVGRSVSMSKLIRRMLPLRPLQIYHDITQLCILLGLSGWSPNIHTYREGASMQFFFFGPKSSFIWLKSQRLRQKKG